MLRTLRYLFSIFVLGGLVYYIYLNREIIPLSELDEHREALAASLLILGVSFFMGGYGWVLILEKMSLRVETRILLRGWFLSQLGKYIPGKIWTAVSRIHLFPGTGNNVQVGYSILLELILINLTGLFIFLCTISVWNYDIPGLENNYFWLLSAIPVCCVVLHPAIMQSVANRILCWMNKAPIEIQLRFGQILELFLYYVVFWCFYGLAFGILASVFTEVTFRTLTIFAGMYIFSIVVGFVSLISPGGLGVREGILSLLLSTQLEIPVAIYLSVVSRVWFTVVEVTLISFFFFQRRGKTTKGVVI